MAAYKAGDRVRSIDKLSPRIGSAGTVVYVYKSGTEVLVIYDGEQSEVFNAVEHLTAEYPVVGDYVRVIVGHPRHGGTFGKVKALNNANRQVTVLVNRHGLHISVEREMLEIVQPHPRAKCPTPQRECIACEGYDEDTAKMNALSFPVEGRTLRIPMCKPDAPKIEIGTEVMVKGGRKAYYENMVGVVSEVGSDEATVRFGKAGLPTVESSFPLTCLRILLP